ncbi:response regulator transcription factor [Bacteriovorax sp. Seq25_V]|uniref:response regulator transcription factor n=1 Tax=Bacteriovorax sp. Seq25_V TaxID=1201288 RepID=UPI000389DF73|nr:response regulator [Bacteriovorax sp. Seq25_V]EQC46896.1 response regulator receiver domain protein [Bacteriovorax sp. Seq25_V]
MKIIIVDDDINFCESLSLDFNDDGFEVSYYNTVASFLKARPACHSLILDLRLGTETSTNFLADIRKVVGSETKIIMLTGYGSISTTVEAMKLGADDYLTKPIKYDVLKSKILDLPLSFKQDNDEALSLDQAEREHIEFVLNSCQGNITKASKILGIHRQSLQRKLKKYSPVK